MTPTCPGPNPVTSNLRMLALPAALVATLALASCGAGPSPAGQQTPGTSGQTTKPPVAGPPVPATSMPATPTATGTPSPVGPPITGASGPADVEFVNTMAFYHVSAEAMADLVPTRAKDAKVKAVAARIKQAQRPEITRLAGWLAGGGIPLPTVQDGEITGHTMAGMGGMTKAMMSKPEMTALSKATGPAFDRMWLRLMIRHHEGAVVTAMAELAKGVNPEARKVAQSIIDRQSGEIATMKSNPAGTSG